MTEQETIIVKRALTNMLNSMLKAKDAPCSSEMHLIESIVDLAKILNIKTFEDIEMKNEFEFCNQIMNELRQQN